MCGVFSLRLEKIDEIRGVELSVSEPYKGTVRKHGRLNNKGVRDFILPLFDVLGEWRLHFPCRKLHRPLLLQCLNSCALLTSCKTSTCWNEATKNNVLLETTKRIHGTLESCVDENLRRLLEGRCGEE